MPLVRVPAHQPPREVARLDPHSYADALQPRARHLRLELEVDFERRVLEGAVTLVLAEPVGGALDLDTKGLTIHRVEAGGQALPWALFPTEPILGRRLRIELPAGVPELTIRYTTSTEAAALQWLPPSQTDGKVHPFLFSQCQAIHARSMVPLADTPRQRVSYSAAITVPDPLTAVMSAGHTRETDFGGSGSSASRPGPRPGTRTFLFDMPQPIPPYLLALAVGDLSSRELGPRSRVWAEPGVVESAAWEFAEMERILQGAERLFGPYDWDRFDMLVLPPSFPYGGMENPRMTFLTPTLLSGDRSLVTVVAHELAHSWTGNLVTNANAEHFWLNEGFTVWAERRILEVIWGEEEAALAWAIGQKGLEAALARFEPGSPATRLRMEMQGVDPDDVYSQIPYEKGSRFLVALEREAGRERFDALIRDYMSTFRFQSITTEELLVFLDERLPGLAERVGAREWLYGTGMPANAPVFRSASLERLAELAAGFAGGLRPPPEEIARWKPTETLAYLQRLPRELPQEDCAWLDATLSLSSRGNHEILVEWLVIAASSDYEPAFPALRRLLVRVGRMKYLRPLYGALGKHVRTRELGRSIFEEAKEGYNHLSRRTAQAVMAGWEDTPAAPEAKGE